jgi:hypothetical protein
MNGTMTFQSSFLISVVLQGWRSPEQKAGAMLSDMYNVGFVFHFCMLGEQHPFGQLNSKER